ncbi:hypothetical protein BKI52_17550 [marine bacterium AO1-C]|nr:hypothetical protein BKI52_17550 [marine bacterium AO1-C]
MFDKFKANQITRSQQIHITGGEVSNTKDYKGCKKRERAPSKRYLMCVGEECCKYGEEEILE